MKNDKPAFSNWMANVTFVVTSPSNRLYPNGHQQVELTVTLQPNAGQEIDGKDLDSIRLMVRDPNGNLQPLSLSGTDHPQGWFEDKNRNEYDYLPSSTQPSACKASVTAVYTRKRYVLNSSKAAGRQLTVYLGITRHIKHKEEWESWDYYLDGSPENGGPSWLRSAEIWTETIPRFNVPSDYVFEENVIRENPATGKFVKEYYLAPYRQQAVLVELLSATMEPAGMIRWARLDPTETHASNVGYASPGSSEFRYNPNIRLGDQFAPVRQADSPRNGHITVVLEGDNAIPFDRDSALNQGGPCRVIATDIYGNDHALSITFDDSSNSRRWKLKIS